MNLLDLMVKVGVDDKATAGLQSIAGTATKTLATAFKVGAAAVGAASAAAAAFTKQAIEAYGTYEQLIGGTKLLYGDAWQFIQDKAQNAYKNVQMSQNDYLQQVNGFAVGLKKSLGGDEQAAAVLADKIVTAEADVVAATGASSESVQNAFNGIMKGNYTMLDNLQLGITPTKKGMESLIKEVNKWNKANGKATKYSIKNTADIMSALTDYIEMQGLAGYAQMEGAETIQGALATVKAAWSNLLVGLADDEADVEELFKNLSDAGRTFFDKIKPKIKTTITGIGTIIKEGLPDAMDFLTEMMPELLQLGIDIVGEIGSAIVTALPNLVNSGLDIITEVARSIASNMKNLDSTGIVVINEVLNSIIDHAPDLISSGVTIISEFVTGLAQNASDLIAAGLAIVKVLQTGVSDNKDEMGGAAFDLLAGLIEGIIKNMPSVAEIIWEQFKWNFIDGGIIGDISKTVVDKLFEGFTADENGERPFVKAGKEMLADLKDGFLADWEEFKQWLAGLWKQLTSIFTIEVNLPTAKSNSPMNGSFHAGGLSYVPYDNYVANLHRGERVLTKTEAEEYNKGGAGAGATVNVYAQTIDKNTMDYIMNNVNLLGGMA